MNPTDKKLVERFGWIDEASGYSPLYFAKKADGEYVQHSAYTALEAEVAKLTKERDEARQLVAEANNSLYGSQGYFHSLNGGEFNKYHLATGIEQLKVRARLAEAAESALAKSEAAREAAEARLAEARKVVIDVLSSLVAAHSLLKRSPKTAAPSNKMFDQMLRDYQASIDRARTWLDKNGEAK